jgi:cystathionine beta-lyase
MVEEFVKNRPPLKLLEMEATYLAWIDCRLLGVNAYELFLEYGVIFNDGKTFGNGGEGFVRLNFGTTRKNLERILERMDKALNSLKR